MVEAALRQPRDPERGRALFGTAGCFACHTVGGEGGALGPALANIRGRFSVRDLLEAILEPSRAISDQYGTVVVTLVDGTQQQGRLVNQNERQVHLSANLFDPTDLVRLDRTRVRDIQPSAISLMPPGLLDPLDADDIADLVAFLLGAR
jgi:putative heme-binding domain-containing protein